MVQKNVAASIRQRLLNHARNDHRPFNELLQYFAMERFLYSLSKSAHAARFILKGAMMLRAWQAPHARPTMDIDLLGKTNNEETRIVLQIQEILAAEVESDGLIFDSGSIQCERITEGAEYRGVRIRFRGTLDSARINMQLDVGFGDIVYPSPEKLELPSMLGFPASRLLCYSRESSIAEKFEAMVKLGILNSRMKDFYDIWLLSRQFDFEGARLAEAMRLTFERRGTTLSEEIDAFQEAFIVAQQMHWAAFCKRLEQNPVPARFEEIVFQIEKFLSPVVSAVLSGQQFSKRWAAANSWN